MSWWNKRQNIEPIKIQPTLGTKLTEAYIEKVKKRRKGKKRK
jgi:hypothetical protein